MTKKRNAQAGEKRKTRAPKVSHEGLDAHKAAMSDPEIFRLSNRFEQLERLREESKLNTAFIALEALTAFAGGLTSGKTEEQLRSTWLRAWGEETLSVPVSLLKAIGYAWERYRRGEIDLTMGEAFEVEAQRPQGSRPMKSRLEAHDRRVSYANAVHIRYLEIEGQKTRTLADCIQEVADKHGIGFETVHDAYVEHRDHVHASLKDMGILRG